MLQNCKLIQSIPFLFLSLAALSGCNQLNAKQSEDTKRDIVEVSGASWYNYGNGLINLSRVTRISSEANISVQVMTREYHDNERIFYEYYRNLNDEARAILDSHADFCFDKIRAKLEGNERRSQHSWQGFEQQDTLGAFEIGNAGDILAKNIATLKSMITPEIAETCVIRLKGKASLEFDSFTVNLTPYENTLVFQPDTEGKFTKGLLDQQFDDSVGNLTDGRTPWDGEYSKIFMK
jgi:hypothetical protein